MSPRDLNPKRVAAKINASKPVSKDQRDSWTPRPHRRDGRAPFLSGDAPTNNVKGQGGDRKSWSPPHGLEEKMQDTDNHHLPKHNEWHEHLAKNSWHPLPSPDALAQTSLELGDHFRIQKGRKHRERIKKTEGLWCASVEMLRLGRGKQACLMR